MARTIPTSPLFVRKISSSTKPNRFTWEQSAAASRYSFVIRFNLNTAEPPHMHRLEFHWVVLGANLRGVQQEAEDLRVGPRRPSREEIQCEKHSHRPGQAIEQIEYARAHDEREEEQLSLGSQDRERTIQ